MRGVVKNVTGSVYARGKWVIWDGCAYLVTLFCIFFCFLYFFKNNCKMN